MRQACACVCIAGLVALATGVHADGSAIDRVYLPYVQPLERELELRLRADRDKGHSSESWRLGYGQAMGPGLFVECYLIADHMPGERYLAVTGQELEARWQLTEPGEFTADWGVIAELEHGAGSRDWEAAATLVASRTWGRWSSTANATLGYETASGRDGELERRFAIQGKYRYRASLEPALEMYVGEDTRAIGPVFMGTARLRPGRKLHWELGVIFGVDDHTPERTLRGLLEYEL